jgi:hypothetical protein
MSFPCSGLKQNPSDQRRTIRKEGPSSNSIIRQDSRIDARLDQDYANFKMAVSHCVMNWIEESLSTARSSDARSSTAKLDGNSYTSKESQSLASKTSKPKSRRVKKCSENPPACSVRMPSNCSKLTNSDEEVPQIMSTASELLCADDYFGEHDLSLEAFKQGLYLLARSSAESSPIKPDLFC